MGISFAIPIDEAIQVSDQLRTAGRVTRGRIGVQIAEVTKDVAESIGLGKPQGALVRQVESGSPADKAGVEAGDIIKPWLILGPFYEDMSEHVIGLSYFEKSGATVGTRSS